MSSNNYNGRIPKLRFPEFSGEWKEKSLEELGFLTAGGTPSTSNSKYWGGDVNWLQSGAVQNCIITEKAVVRKITKLGLQNSAAYLIRPNSVLIAITGATCANVGYLTFESAANQSVVSVEPNSDNNAMFLYQILLTERANILSYKGGSAQSGVTLGTLKKMKILVPPSLAEQEKIASCLSELDNMIAEQGQKVDSLKGKKQALMQQLIPLPGETEPRLRFPGFEGAWVEKKLGDILIERKEVSVITDDLPQLSFTIAEGVIRPEDRKTNQRDFLMKDKDSKRFSVTRLNDIIYNPANVVFGAIHKNNLCDGVVSPIYKIFWTKENSDFLNYLLRRPSFIALLASRAEGTVTKLKTLKADAFLDMLVPFPVEPSEQEMIADCLVSLDELITVENNKLDLLKNHKKGLVQQLFPHPIE